MTCRKFGKHWIRAGLLLAMAVGLTGCGEAKQKSEPVTITVWTYYNGEQLENFERLVTEFNATTGKEKQITVVHHSQGNVNDLEVNVRNAAEEKVGAEPMPNLFSAYADTAYYMDHKDLAVDLNAYLTEEERSQYIAGYLEEGDLDRSGSLKIFPVAKSTELLFVNDTDWQVFAEETGSQYSELETIEGVIEVAERYYEWTDAMTEEPDDGRAFFGRDAMANYMYIGARQLGDSIYEIDETGKMHVTLQETTARKLWNCYYVPFVKGYFSAAGRFRSDDVKTGNILAYVGSNSSATFFPTSTTIDDQETHDIEMKVLACPKFKGGQACAVQQGAGMVVTKKSEEEIRASVEFLKWFTSTAVNLQFVTETDYLPVMKEANNLEAVHQYRPNLSEVKEAVLDVAFREIESQPLYTPAACLYGKEARSVLEYSMSDLAVKDRATVDARIENGIDGQEAMAEFLTEEYFRSWYQEIRAQLCAYEG